MSRSWRLAAALVVIALIGAPGPATLAAKKAKKSVPAHPDELRYGPLDFEVPDAADYRHELSNGIPVYIAEDHALPLVTVSITLRAGGFLDTEDKPGVATSTGTMIRLGGAGEMSAEEFDEKVDFLAAEISTSTGDLSSSASFNCITDVVDETAELFFTMLKRPRFQQDRIDVERENFLEEMKQRNDSPQSISSREWGWLMRGRDFFAARAITRDELFAITRDDLIAFHERYWRPPNMLIAVSGDVDTEQFLAKLEQWFAGWETDGPQVPWPPPRPEHTPAPGVYYVDKEIPQGRVLLGHLGYERNGWDDPEAFSLSIMNDILGGGGFTSRMVKRIRSDEGLAYSAGSSYGVGQYWPGVFQAFYQSKSDTVAFAAEIALEEIDRIRQGEVSEDELTTAKNSFIDVFPRRFESAGQIVGTFVDDEYDG
ncbi:MAG TPA: pitrilysin family protein, partial [Candidatus Polarisedimenticolaceae bacterium]|nr:pitrilysin family protein [Candidatus Polarisedimenticolaceae bacterium]